MTIDPIQEFRKWQEEETQLTDPLFVNACCLSTHGLDGFPNARFVSLKTIIDSTFVITGSLRSRKGQELQLDPKLALTFWWTQTGRQVRIQGTASLLDEQKAREFFYERNKDSQLVSYFFEQGKTIRDEHIEELFAYARSQYENKEVPFPEHWAAFKINPLRIEFLEFEKTRLHKRRLFEWNKDTWNQSLLQP